jgi:hypothetical protein
MLTTHSIEEGNVMKRFIFCLLLAQLAMPLQAQDNTQQKQNKLDELVTILQISASQSPEFVVIMNAQHAQRKNIHSQYSETRKAQHKAMKMLHYETIEKLQGILSGSQLEAFKAIKAKQHRNRSNKKHRQVSEDADA